jgi:hypothetical protein
MSLDIKRPAAWRATVAGLHMRTWSNALPRRPHAGSASVEREAFGTMRGEPVGRKKARPGAGLAGPPYALAK